MTVECEQKEKDYLCMVLFGALVFVQANSALETTHELIRLEQQFTGGDRPEFEAQQEKTTRPRRNRRRC